MPITFPTKPVLAVDWDGTCVHEVYPAEGDWLPGAIDALRHLQKHYQVYIYTARIAPTVHKEWHKKRPAGEVERDIAYIERMLRDANLKRVKLWKETFKIPAIAYIDDRGIRFTDWDSALEALANV